MANARSHPSIFSRRRRKEGGRGRRKSIKGEPDLGEAEKKGEETHMASLSTFFSCGIIDDYPQRCFPGKKIKDLKFCHVLYYYSTTEKSYAFVQQKFGAIFFPSAKGICSGLLSLPPPLLLLLCINEGPIAKRRRENNVDNPSFPPSSGKQPSTTCMQWRSPPPPLPLSFLHGFLSPPRYLHLLPLWCVRAPSLLSERKKEKRMDGWVC